MFGFKCGKMKLCVATRKMRKNKANPDGRGGGANQPQQFISVLAMGNSKAGIGKSAVYSLWLLHKITLNELSDSLYY